MAMVDVVEKGVNAKSFNLRHEKMQRGLFSIVRKSINQKNGPCEGYCSRWLFISHQLVQVVRQQYLPVM